MSAFYEFYFICPRFTNFILSTRAELAEPCEREPAARCLVSLATMPRRLATRLLLLAVAFADEADDTRAAAAADHMRAGELKELTKAGVEFG